MDRRAAPRNRYTTAAFACAPVLALALASAWGCHGGRAEPYPEKIECDGLTLILVPKGERMIGTNNSRAERWERPACLYRMNKALYMGQTEVTAALYRRLFPSWPYTIADDEPALVSWEQAKGFCDRFREVLEKHTSRKWEVRLPTEAEWEYAARYGRPPVEDWWPTAWDEEWHGPNALMDLAWYARNSDDRLVHPVAQKRPNPLGLYDMLGNAPERCEGWLTSSVQTMLKEDGKPDDAYEPESYLDGSPQYGIRPSRGGSSSSSEDDCRPSRRRVWNTCGFRIVALPRD